MRQIYLHADMAIKERVSFPRMPETLPVWPQHAKAIT
ncbi:hypothetical protein BC739_000891 [Kutzneria viridogrisea]|uniref:Uncharacterized protein n=1 Tax=Kutzneria viridogrisea TaxID=47990 RepID=A0ABR6BAQ7_9PSEU|nr:hypothetical protein [Kutzneria viridogrisea]